MFGHERINYTQSDLLSCRPDSAALCGDSQCCSWRLLQQPSFRPISRGDTGAPYTATSEAPAMTGMPHSLLMSWTV